jgi:hypothetical protein
MILLFIVAFLLFSCGSGESYEETPAPKPPQNGEKLTFNSDVKPLLVTFCDQCHSGATFMASEQAFRASKAPTRIANGSMPQKGSANYNKWGEAQRSTIAKFVAQAE